MLILLAQSCRAPFCLELAHLWNTTNFTLPSSPCPITPRPIPLPHTHAPLHPWPLCSALIHIFRPTYLPQHVLCTIPFSTPLSCSDLPHILPDHKNLSLPHPPTPPSSPYSVLPTLGTLLHPTTPPHPTPVTTPVHTHSHPTPPHPTPPVSPARAACCCGIRGARGT